MWSTSLRPIYANGPQLICTHCVEKEICWKGECYVGTKSSGLFLSWAAAMPSSGALVSDNDTWPCPHAPKHLVKYLFLFIFYFISYLLQTITHDQAPKLHNILSRTRPFFRFSCFTHYPIHYTQEHMTKPPQPKTASQVLCKSFGLLCFITCCRQWHIGACQ